MAQINLLSKETIDKIAAGEVVERPSSVVKELLENAIDAGATAVTVEIKEGGISFIRVTDNGCGIDKREAPKAFLRHATSKISCAEDLAHVVSLGFRGEALSSIAAVSKLELITKTAQELTGLRYVVEGGMEKEAEEIGAPEGTTIIVRNLFFNTPVRKKFLRQPQTEGSYVSDLMEHMALSNPGVSFKYVNNGQTRFHTSGNQNLQEIIYRIYGRDISSALLPVDVAENGIRMYGFLGRPEINRANRNFEIYFVNGRFIKSSIVGRAIEEGYRRYVMQHKFPFAVLHFRIDSQDIDVNVHPTKMEVRFTNQAALYDFISAHITEALHRTELIPEVVLKPHREEAKEKAPAASVPEPFETGRLNKVENIVKEENPYTASKKEGSSFFVDNRTASFLPMQDILQKQPQSKVIGTENRTEQAENAKNHANIIKAKEHIFVEKPTQIDLFEEKMLTKEARAEYRIMGQLFATYWLVAFHDKLFIIDQHAAHEKVKYEKLMKEYRNKQVQSQMLHPPLVVTLTGKEEQVVKDHKDIFAAMGFEIEAFGGNEYTIRSVPSDLYGLSESALFTEMLDELAGGPVKGTPEAISGRIATMACKAAVKGNRPMGAGEAEALIDELLLLEDPYHCPHGRPTIIAMSKYEIEKKFKRIV